MDKAGAKVARPPDVSLNAGPSEGGEPRVLFRAGLAELGLEFDGEDTGASHEDEVREAGAIALDSGLPLATAVQARAEVRTAPAHDAGELQDLTLEVGFGYGAVQPLHGAEAPSHGYRLTGVDILSPEMGCDLGLLLAQ